jgi:hypothetical protein
MNEIPVSFLKLQTGIRIKSDGDYKWSVAAILPLAGWLNAAASRWCVCLEMREQVPGPAWRRYTGSASLVSWTDVGMDMLATLSFSCILIGLFLLFLIAFSLKTWREERQDLGVDARIILKCILKKRVSYAKHSKFQ